MKLQTVLKLMPARKVLVIDDDDTFCMLLATMLTHWGYSVTSTQAQSIDFDEMTEADIIFLDIMMPVMNGLQVLELLSSHQIKSSIVLMSSAENEILVTAEAFAKRNDLQLIGVLYKPFRVSDVLAVLWAT